MRRQTTNHILMIRPVAFTYNVETASDNHYQIPPAENETHLIQQNAVNEFDTFVKLLRQNGVTVTVIEDTREPATPDSIFPNNWVSFHEGGETIIYPMLARNRRAEKRMEIIEELIRQQNLNLAEVIDYSPLEERESFLEGSMILDRANGIAYAAVSERMHPEALKTFCERMQYQPILFHALQTVHNRRLPIYHTNVMMCLGTTFAVVCLDSIDDVDEKKQVVQSLTATGKQIVPISEDQVAHFAGNMLELYNNTGERLLVMSSSAFHVLNDYQRKTLSEHCRILHSPLPTIERNGGGSARCMMAEVFLSAASDKTGYTKKVKLAVDSQ